MPTLHITRGLPGSGKTYWAGSWAAEDVEQRVRVNRDDLRQMLNDGRFIKGVTEQRVIAVRDASISALLRKGVDVACDDTNLSQRNVRDLITLAHNTNSGFEVHDFTDVPVDLCVQRDAARDRTVGEGVIRDLHTRYLRGRTLPLPLPDLAAEGADAAGRYEAKPGTPKTVLVDVDGTVALMGERRPYDWARVGEDTPNSPVIDVVRALFANGYRIVVMSGRDATCREATEAWLSQHLGVPYTGPFMRAAGDNRKDSVVKVELFDRHIRDTYDVVCVLDDRDQVVRAWRGIGLTVLQVAEGAF